MLPALKKLVQRALRRTGYELVRHSPVEPLPTDFEAAAAETIGRVRQYTMTSTARIYSLVKAVEYVVSAGIEGAIVECGVWRGGSMMAVALTLQRLGQANRDLWLYDTFSGMSEPGAEDVSHAGMDAREEWRVRGAGGAGYEWCTASLEDVTRNLASTGYDPARLRLVRGKIEETVPAQAPPGPIALLRLDTDWYESTRHELLHLYPRLAPGGVLVIDDYGYWQGARKAVDEYLGEHGLKIFLARIDHTGRIAIKPV